MALRGEQRLIETQERVGLFGVAWDQLPGFRWLWQRFASRGAVGSDRNDFYPEGGVELAGWCCDGRRWHGDRQRWSRRQR